MLRGRSRWPGPAADLPELWSQCPRAASPPGRPLELLELRPDLASFPPPARCPSRSTEAPQLEAPSDRCRATPLCRPTGAGQLATADPALEAPRPAGPTAAPWGSPDQPDEGLCPRHTAGCPGDAALDAASPALVEPLHRAHGGRAIAERERDPAAASRRNAVAPGHRLGRTPALP